MFRRRGNIHWYDCLLIAIAAAIVYPDTVVDWLSQSMGRVLGVGTSLMVEFMATGGMVAAMVILLPI